MWYIIDLLCGIGLIGLVEAMFIISRYECTVRAYNPSPRFANGDEKRLDKIDLVAPSCISFKVDDVQANISSAENSCETGHKVKVLHRKFDTLPENVKEDLLTTLDNTIDKYLDAIKVNKK